MSQEGEESTPSVSSAVATGIDTGSTPAPAEAGDESGRGNPKARPHKVSDLAVLEVSALDEIDAGSCEGMLVEDFPKVRDLSRLRRHRVRSDIKIAFAGRTDTFSKGKGCVNDCNPCRRGMGGGVCAWGVCV